MKRFRLTFLSLLMPSFLRMYIDDPAGGGGGGGNPQPEPQTFSLEYVRELRNENKGLRLRASEYEGKASKAAEDAAKAIKDAEEKSTAASSAASKAANDRIARAELKAVAVKAGIVDLDGLKLVDLSKLTLDDQGEVQGADALIDELKKAKPYLFGAASTSSGAKAPPSDPPAKKLAKDMTDAEYAAARAAFR